MQDVKHARKQNITIIVVFIADSVSALSGHYTVKHHGLDAVISVNLICMELEEENCLSYLWLDIVSALPLCPLTLRYNAAFAVLQSTRKAPAV